MHEKIHKNQNCTVEEVVIVYSSPFKVISTVGDTVFATFLVIKPISAHRKKSTLVLKY